MEWSEIGHKHSTWELGWKKSGQGWSCSWELLSSKQTNDFLNPQFKSGAASLHVLFEHQAATRRELLTCPSCLSLHLVIIGAIFLEMLRQVSSSKLCFGYGATGFLFLTTYFWAKTHKKKL